MNIQLQQAVLNQLGIEDLTDQEDLSTIEDIVNHGIGCGFNGFIYYADTVKFFDDNRDLILSELSGLADELGEDPIKMVQGFNCLDGDYNGEAFDVIANINCEDDAVVKNALSWFAAEEAARSIIDERDNY